MASASGYSGDAVAAMPQDSSSLIVAFITFNETVTKTKLKRNTNLTKNEQEEFRRHSDVNCK